MKVKLKDGMYVRSPKNATTSKNVTPGKLYKISNVDNLGIPGFNIIGDDGTELYCLAYDCAHLDYDMWEIVSDHKIVLFFQKLFESNYYWYVLHMLAGIGFGYLLFKFLS